jgi:hypothetical protein
MTKAQSALKALGVVRRPFDPILGGVAYALPGCTDDGMRPDPRKPGASPLALYWLGRGTTTLYIGPAVGRQGSLSRIADRYQPAAESPAAIDAAVLRFAQDCANPEAPYLESSR